MYYIKAITYATTLISLSLPTLPPVQLPIAAVRSAKAELIATRSPKPVETIRRVDLGQANHFDAEIFARTPEPIQLLRQINLSA